MLVFLGAVAVLQGVCGAPLERSAGLAGGSGSEDGDDDRKLPARTSRALPRRIDEEKEEVDDAEDGEEEEEEVVPVNDHAAAAGHANDDDGDVVIPADHIVPVPPNPAMANPLHVPPVAGLPATTGFQPPVIPWAQIAPEEFPIPETYNRNYAESLTPTAFETHLNPHTWQWRWNQFRTTVFARFTMEEQRAFMRMLMLMTRPNVYDSILSSVLRAAADSVVAAGRLAELHDRRMDIRRHFNTDWATWMPPAIRAQRIRDTERSVIDNWERMMELNSDAWVGNHIMRHWLVRQESERYARVLTGRPHQRAHSDTRDNSRRRSRDREEGESKDERTGSENGARGSGTVAGAAFVASETRSRKRNEEEEDDDTDSDSEVEEVKPPAKRPRKDHSDDDNERDGEYGVL